MDVPVNYVAVLVAALSNMVIGFLWYGPLFGKAWVKMTGVVMGADAKSKANMGYLISYVGAALVAYVLSHFIYLTAQGYGTEITTSSAISTAFWGWLGFIVPTTVGMVIWEQKPWALWFMNAAYWLISLAVMAVILVGMGSY